MSTQGYTRWTVIPRGMTGNIFKFALAVTPTLQDWGANPPFATDVAPWNNWPVLVTAGAELLSQLLIEPLIRNNTPDSTARKTIACNLPGLTPPPYFNNVWSQLLAYMNSDWTTAAAQQDVDGTSSHLSKARHLQPRTTATHRLHAHLNKLHSGSIIGMKRRRAGPAGSQMLTAAHSKAAHEAVAASIRSLSFAARYDTVPQPPDAAGEFRKWLDAEIASGDQTRKLNALAAERNLYRLADNPYNTLDVLVLAHVQSLAYPNSQPPKATAIKVPPGATLSQEKKDLIEHAIFHRRYKSKPLGPKQDQQQKLAATTTIVDFYRSLALLSHYPELLAQFGLSWECHVDIGAAGLATGQKFAAAFIPPDSLWPETTMPKAPLFTLCTGAGFPLSTTNGEFQLNRGMLVTKDCEIVTRDVDGEALRVIMNSNAAAQQTANPVEFNPPQNNTDETANPPDPTLAANADQYQIVPMRSIGISVLHTQAHRHAISTLQRVFNLRDHRNPGGAPAPTDNPWLELGDLVRGYTVKVFVDEAKTPISLTSRHVTYTLVSSQQKLIEADQADAPLEISAAATSDSVVVKPDPNEVTLPDLHQHPSLFRWAGWGLSVDSPLPKLPGASTVQSGQPAKAPFPILTTYTPPKSAADLWPKLRFGSKYTLELQALDLLCKAMDEGTTNQVASDADTQLCVDYRRSDAVHGPQMLLELYSLKRPQSVAECFHRGETLACIVLRDTESQPRSRRILVPPVAAFDLLVQHGVLDTEHGFKKLDKIGSFDDVELMEDGSFPIIDDAQRDSNGLVVVEAKNTVPLYRKALHEPCPRTYLPDPMAEHLAIECTDLSDPQACLHEIAGLGNFYSRDDDGYKAQWPHASRLVVEMESASGAEVTSRWATQGGAMTLFVGVPAGWQVRLLMKCVPKKKHVEEFFDLPNTIAKQAKDAAVWLQQQADQLVPNVRALATPAAVQALESSLSDASVLADELAKGNLDAVTPATELLLVHAVRRPLAPCTFDRSQNPVYMVTRDYDSPKSCFTVTANIGDRRSTGKVELVASWTDTVDSPPGKHNEHFAQTVHLKQWPLSLQSSGSQSFVSVPQTFPDTNYRVVKLSLNAISRFEQLYQNAPTTPGRDESGFITNDPKDELSITILNTARLAAPRLDRIMPLRPAFTDPIDKEWFSYKRYGGAFRIYLQRPWQGEQDEQLGITLWGEYFDPPPQSCYTSADCFAPVAYSDWGANSTGGPSTLLEPYVTRWGADPGLIGALPTLAPVSGDFFHPRTASGGPMQAVIRKCAFAAELPLPDDHHPVNCDPRILPYFTIATYPVRYDEKQKLWFADVQLKHAHSGFVRFGLTRYQPHSLVNRECSPVTTAPLLPIPPQRELYFRQEHGHKVTLVICGTSQEGNATGSGRFFSLELQFKRILLVPSHTDRWERAPEHQQPVPVPSVALPQASEYPVLGAYSFHTNRIDLLPHKYRVVVDEFEPLFADDPTDRSHRLVKSRKVDTMIVPIH